MKLLTPFDHPQEGARQPLSTESAKLFGMNARPLPAVELKALLAQMQQDGGLEDCNATQLWCHEVVLPFYRDYKLYSLLDFSSPCPELTRVLYKPGSLYELDWTNEPIYTVNELAPVRIQHSTILPYLRFFFGSVCARLGGFRIVETPADVPWLADATGEERAEVESRLKPMNVASVDVQGIYRVPATVLFMQGLFTVDVMVASRPASLINPEEESVESMSIGQSALHNEELLIENLNVREYCLHKRERSAFHLPISSVKEVSPEADPSWMN